MIFYRFGIILYQILIFIASFWNPKAKQAWYGRKKWRKLAQQKSKPKGVKRLWIHAASLGEYEQAVPLIEHYKNQNYEILVSFFSPSGYEARKNATLIDHVCYLPFDSKRNAKDFMRLYEPDMVFFIKYEFWFFFLDAINKAEIPCFLISGVFRKDQLFFKKWIGPIFVKKLKAFTYFFLQDLYSSQLIEELGYSNQLFTGDTRFDRVENYLEEEKKLLPIEQFCSQDSRKTIILGSSWPKEESLLQSIYPQIKSTYKIIIAPHDIQTKHLQEIQERFSTYDNYLYQDYKGQQADFLIIDHIGSLSHAYKFADLAFIGGAFGSGLHNILEAIIWGKPILFGPKHHKFHEAEKAIQKGIAFEIKDSKELLEGIKHISKEDASLFASRAQSFVAENKNATSKIIQQIDLVSFN